MTPFTSTGRLSLAMLTVISLWGCAAQQEHRKGMDLMQSGNTVEAVDSLRRASSLEPDNVRYRMDYLQQRSAGLATVLADADAARAAGRLDNAAQRYREALRLEAQNDRARAGLLAVESDRRVQAHMLAVDKHLQANQTEQAAELLRQVLKEQPQHTAALALRRQVEQRQEAERVAREEQLAARAAFKRPVTLQLRDAGLRMAIEALAKAGNVNLILDRDVRADQRTTIFVKDASVEDTLDIILLQNQLEKRVLNSNSLLIYPATAAKQKELAELKIRTFQLSNVEAAFMANIIKTMLKTRDIVTDAKTNTLVLRDTAEAVALAERLVAANDLPDPEVMLEVEVLEVSSSRVSEIGLKLPNSLSLSTPSVADAAGFTLGALRRLRPDNLVASPLSGALNLMMQDGDTNILASPRIRARHKEKARVLVGDKLPVITNIISPQQAGQNSILTGSVQYVDVGIKLEVEPQVYADGDVGIKLNLEISNVSDTIVTQGGRAYQIGTRSAQTALRLHDGETQIMAGLISDDDRKSAQKLPGLGQMPMLGRLFSNHSDDTKKREIVLSITPRVVRPLAQPDQRFAEAWSGSETSLRDRALRIEPLSMLKSNAPPAGPAPVSGSNSPGRAMPPTGVVVPARPLPGAAIPVSPVAPAPSAAPTSAPTPDAAPQGNTEAGENPKP